MISDSERKSVQDFTYRAGQKFHQHIIVGPTFFSKNRSRVRHVIGYDGHAFDGTNSTLTKQYWTGTGWQTTDFASYGSSNRQAHAPFTGLVHTNAIAVLRDTVLDFVPEAQLRWSHSKPGEIDIRDYMRSYRDLPVAYSARGNDAYMRDWLRRDLLSHDFQPAGKLTPIVIPQQPAATLNGIGAKPDFADRIMEELARGNALPANHPRPVTQEVAVPA